jgi:uncharacterized membrane protein YfcA
MLTFVGIGLLAGGLGALLGVGGGVILVPGLVLFGGLPFTAAVGTSLVCIVGTSTSAAAEYLRQDRVDVGWALEFQWYTVLGAVVASLAAASIPARPLEAAFAVLLVVTAVRMWPKQRVASSSHATQKAHPAIARTAGVGAGAVAGFLGIGGGIINVPILHLLLGVPFERAVATSVYVIGVTASAGGAVYLMRGHVDVATAGGVLLGVIAGAAGAARVGHRLDQRGVKGAFALLLLYVAVRMGWRVFGAG